MTRALTLVMFLTIVLMIAVFYTFTAAYMACSDKIAVADGARSRLDDECGALEERMPELNALAYKFVPSIQRQVITTELAAARLGERRSPSDMARACRILTAGISNLVIALEATEAKKLGTFDELCEDLADTVYKLNLAKEEYNQAAAAYNAALDKPMARLWRKMMGFSPMELFAVDLTMPAAVPERDPAPVIVDPAAPQAWPASPAAKAQATNSPAPPAVTQDPDAGFGE